MVEYTGNSYVINATLTREEYRELTQAVYEYRSREQENFNCESKLVKQGLMDAVPATTLEALEAITGACKKIDRYDPEYSEK